MQVVRKFRDLDFKKKFSAWVLGMTGLVLLCYSGITYKTKSNDLELALSVAVRTLKNSIESGDWDTAISHAKLVSAENRIFSLSVDYGDERMALISAIGAPEFGFGSVCKTLSHSQYYHISGCTRILSRWDMLGMLMAVVGIVTPFFALMVESKRREMLLQRSQTQEMELSTFAYELLHEIKKPILSGIRRIEEDDQIPDALKEDISQIFARPQEWITKALRDFMSSRVENRTSKIPQSSENRRLCTIGTVLSIRRQYPFLASQSGNFVFNRRLVHEFCALGSNELYFCVQNLLSNAVDASSEGNLSDISLRLAYRIEEGQRRYCDISIRDCGSPFSPEAMAAFNEGVPFTSKGDRGSGLGLLSVRRKIDRIGGKLKLLQEDDFKVITLVVPLIDSPSWLARLDSLRGDILLLDDDPLMKERLLSNFPGSFSVSQFIDENEFLVAANAKPGSTLLIDYDFRGSVDGLTFISTNSLVGRSVLISGLVPSSHDITARAGTTGVPLFSKESLI